MRGEYISRIPTNLPCAELPPRARRIRSIESGFVISGGTTSACAENTFAMAAYTWSEGNYLRVRGEYPAHRSPRPPRGELPPRARRILDQAAKKRRTTGTTSACAENTCTPGFNIGVFRNYLRVRGEYRKLDSVSGTKKELPPRARRIP